MWIIAVIIVIIIIVIVGGLYFYLNRDVAGVRKRLEFVLDTRYPEEIVLVISTRINGKYKEIMIPVHGHRAVVIWDKLGVYNGNVKTNINNEILMKGNLNVEILTMVEGNTEKRLVNSGVNEGIVKIHYHGSTSAIIDQEILELEAILREPRLSEGERKTYTKRLKKLRNRLRLIRESGVEPKTYETTQFSSDGKGTSVVTENPDGSISVSNTKIKYV